MGHVQGQWPDIDFKTSEGSFRVSELGVDKGVSLSGYAPFIDADLDTQQALVLMLRLAQALGFEGGATYTALQIEVARLLRRFEDLKRQQQREADEMSKVMSLAGLLSTKYFKRPWNQLCDGQKEAMIDLAKASIQLDEKGK